MNEIIDALESRARSAKSEYDRLNAVAVAMQAEVDELICSARKELDLAIQAEKAIKVLRAAS